MLMLYTGEVELLVLRKSCSNHQFEEKQHADFKRDRIATLSFSTKRLASERGVSPLPPGLSPSCPRSGQDPLICQESFGSHSGDCLNPSCTGLHLRLALYITGVCRAQLGLEGGASGEAATSRPFLHNSQRRE